MRKIIAIALVATLFAGSILDARNGGGRGGGRGGGARSGGARVGGARAGGARVGGARVGGARVGGARVGGARVGGARVGGARVGGRGGWNRGWNRGGLNRGGWGYGGWGYGGGLGWGGNWRYGGGRWNRNWNHGFGWPGRNWNGYRYRYWIPAFYLASLYNNDYPYWGYRLGYGRRLVTYAQNEDWETIVKLLTQRLNELEDKLENASNLSDAQVAEIQDQIKRIQIHLDGITAQQQGTAPIYGEPAG